MKVLVTQPTAATGAGSTAVVRFVKNGVTKTYRLFSETTTNNEQGDADALLAASDVVGNELVVQGVGIETSEEKIEKARAALDSRLAPIGVSYTLTPESDGSFTLTLTSGATSLRLAPFTITVRADTITVEGYAVLEVSLEKTMLDAGETTLVRILALTTDGAKVDVTESQNLVVSVEDPDVASYANGALTALRLGKTRLRATYTDREQNMLGTAAVVTVGEERAPLPEAIYVNGGKVPDLSLSRTRYAYVAPVAPTLSVTVDAGAPGVFATVSQPESVPGSAVVSVTTAWGQSATYTVDISHRVALSADAKTVSVDLGNPGDTDVRLYVAIAAYDADGRLVDAASSALTTAPARASVPGVTASLSCDTTDLTVWAFVLDERFLPYTAAWHLKDPKTALYYENLALRQPVRASTSETNLGNVPANTVDGNRTSTRWASSSGTYPNWIEVDLGEVCELDSLELYWYVNATRTYYYTVWARSEPISDWTNVGAVTKDFAAAGYTLVSDKTNNTVYGHTTDNLKGIFARYLVVHVSGSSTGGSPSIFEIEVSGSK